MFMLSRTCVEYVVYVYVFVRTGLNFGLFFCEPSSIKAKTHLLLYSIPIPIISSCGIDGAEQAGNLS